MADTKQPNTDEATDISVDGQQGTATRSESLPPGSINELHGMPSATVSRDGVAAAAAPAMASSTSVPGVYVDASKVVVLASRLGRGQERLPKVDPDDENERPQYFVPEAFERGQVIDVSAIPAIPGMDNVVRLRRIGAIGGLDHPDAQAAIAAYDYRTQQERRVAAERGIIVGEPQVARV